LANPLSSDMNVLRPALLPGLLTALQRNIHHRNHDLALFEIGRVFARKQNSSVEERRVAMALTGRRQAPFWSGENRDAKLDIYDLKGCLEEFFEQFGVRGLNYVRRTEAHPFCVESALVQIGQNGIGELGLLSPVLARRYDLRDPVLVAEINLDLVLARRNTAKSFKSLPQFPAIQRDVAMLLPEATAHEAVLSVIKQAKVPNLEGVELFDVYRGENVPAGQRSVAYSMTYRNAERTLTDAEVNTAHDKLIDQLKQRLQASIRA